MIHIIKCLQYDHQSDLIKYSQDYRGFQGVSFFFRKTKGTQEIVTVSLSFGITKVEWINSILEIIAKFMFIQVTK